jgi:hypothetical protein
MILFVIAGPWPFAVDSRAKDGVASSPVTRQSMQHHADQPSGFPQRRVGMDTNVPLWKANL